MEEGRSCWCDLEAGEFMRRSEGVGTRRGHEKGEGRRGVI